MTRLSCHRFRSNEVRLWLSVIAYNLGNLWRRLGAASEDRQLVADEPAPTIGQDGRPADQARTILLAATGRAPSDAMIVWEHGAQDGGAVGVNRVKIGEERRIF